MLRPLREPSGLPFVCLLRRLSISTSPTSTTSTPRNLGTSCSCRIQRAVASIPGVGNVHIGRWGEGSEHFHIWFMARTARMEQLRSSFAAIWDDILPPTPREVWDADRRALVRNALTE